MCANNIGCMMQYIMIRRTKLSIVKALKSNNDKKLAIKIYRLVCIFLKNKKQRALSQIVMGN